MQSLHCKEITLLKKDRYRKRTDVWRNKHCVCVCRWPTDQLIKNANACNASLTWSHLLAWDNAYAYPYENKIIITLMNLLSSFITWTELFSSEKNIHHFRKDHLTRHLRNFFTHCVSPKMCDCKAKAFNIVLRENKGWSSSSSSFLKKKKEIVFEMILWVMMHWIKNQLSRLKKVTFLIKLSRYWLLGLAKKKGIRRRNRRRRRSTSVKDFMRMSLLRKTGLVINYWLLTTVTTVTADNGF